MSLELQELSPVEIDELPFGVVQLDARGRVTLYNKAESRLSGLAPERVIGRDFFREVAPCTGLPHFHGRFLEGVRRGDLDAEFEWVFSFDPPVRVRVHMVAAQEPERYWLIVRKLDSPDLSVRRMVADAARKTVERQSRAEPVDADQCAREPIHIPGAVQRHATLLVVDPVDAVVGACSDSVAETFGLEPAAVIGRPLDAVLPAGLAAELLASTTPTKAHSGFRWKATLGPAGRAFAVAAHRHDGRLIVELEMVTSRPDVFEPATPHQAYDAVARLRGAATLADAAAACAEHLRRLTGFERVLIYRFNAEWNGEAMGESLGEGYSSLLGLRFPASDIPAQARALYTRAPARFVFDRDAVPAAILAAPPAEAAEGRAIDLSMAHSRALSPIHLQYQRNLGVNGSMSISIVIDGVLWGLVIGHHRRPHYVHPDTRALAGVVTDAFALRVHELATTLAWKEQQDALRCQNALLRQLAGADDPTAALTGQRPGEATLRDLFEASGAAVVSDDSVATVGSAPSPADILGLAGWLRREGLADGRAFATAELSRHWPPAADWPQAGAGLLAAAADAERRHLLLWFRAEAATAVAWGGNPNKPVLADDGSGAILPRRSFERWVEERHNKAEPWAAWQIEAAEGFAAALEGVVLRQGRRIEDLAARERQLTAALQQQEVLTREIDHRIKNSLQFVASILLLQTRRIDEPEAKIAFQNAYSRVMSIARVHDRLRRSDTAGIVDLGETLQGLCDDLSASIAGGERPIDVDAEPGLLVPSRTAAGLAVIATELITNALQHAYPAGVGGSIAVSLWSRPADGLVLRVCDEGSGLRPDWDVAQRGGGLGMRVIAAMLEQANATLSVDKSWTQGTCFDITI